LKAVPQAGRGADGSSKPGHSGPPIAVGDV
jgi:hypothetical protein